MTPAPPLRIGLLYSTSGTTSLVEAGQLQTALLAIDEINTAGALRFEAVVEDIRSDPEVAARKAASLLKKQGADVLIGCWTSACRKAVLPVLTETGGLLLYTTNYEGQEGHPGVIYLGAVPNQQVDSILSWVVGNLASRFILIGSDYIYPHSTNHQVRQWLERLDGQGILLERYFPLGFGEFGSFLKEIRSLVAGPTPVVIFSTLVGSSVASFYRQYQQAGFSAPIVSPITSECEIAAMGAQAAAGHYCTSGYFQTLATTENRRFVAAYGQRFGAGPINGSMAFAYNAVHFLALACRELRKEQPEGRLRPAAIRDQLRHLSYDAPEGRLIVDPQTQHLWLWSRIGRVGDDGRIDIVWSSPGPIPPRPYGEGFQPQLPPRPLQDETSSFSGLIGASPRFLEKVQLTRIAASTQASVLITGESGTGKELFAQAIHAASNRSHGPFLPINCAAIPRELIGSELFGYEDGAFTGAKKGGKAGRFEQAHGGTLFLDEIGEMPLELQGHLLRVLQEGEIYRLGGKEPIPVDVRVIAATNRDLAQEIAFKGSFRSDLYYRLNVFTIALPALRERPEDILLLAEHFLHKLVSRNGRDKNFSSLTRQRLREHGWPGNVRELANTVERAFHVSLNATEILPEHIAEESSRILPPPSLDERSHTSTTNLREQERGLIRQAISAADCNLSRAAKSLGISRSTLYRKMEGHGLSLVQRLGNDGEKKL